MSLVFFEFKIILFLSAQLCMASSTSCIWLVAPSWTDSSWVQSSAYFHVSTTSESGTESSRSLICTLKSVGDMTDPWGTPAGQGITENKLPPNLTCWLLPSRKLIPKFIKKTARKDIQQQQHCRHIMPLQTPQTRQTIRSVYLLDKLRDNYNCRPPILKAHIYWTWGG